MAREVRQRMLWLAPPVLFSAGLGITQPSDNDSWSFRPDPELFVDARVAYPLEDGFAVGARVRGSHTRIEWSDTVAPRPFDQFLDQFELYTLEVGAFGELDLQYVCFMGWVGVHTARVHARYHHYTDDQSATFAEQEDFFTGPAMAGGFAFGVNVYNRRRLRVTVYAEAAFAHAFLTNKSLEDDSYSYSPLSLGLAVRF
jgi:hypothetical protein